MDSSLDEIPKHCSIAPASAQLPIISSLSFMAINGGTGQQDHQSCPRQTTILDELTPAHLLTSWQVISELKAVRQAGFRDSANLGELTSTSVLTAKCRTLTHIRDRLALP
jgi:hypothetical protein